MIIARSAGATSPDKTVNWTRNLSLRNMSATVMPHPGHVRHRRQMRLRGSEMGISCALWCILNCNIPRFQSQFSSYSDRQSHSAGVFRRPRRRRSSSPLGYFLPILVNPVGTSTAPCLEKNESYRLASRFRSTRPTADRDPNTKLPPISQS